MDFLDDNDAVEVCARIGKNGAEPIKVTGVVNDHLKEYIRQVKAYEKHAVKAALEGSKIEAMRALVMNPLCGDLRTASACFDEMVEAHKEFLPQFCKEEN
jgi:6-phospho-beta-glucosidase